MLKKSVQYVRGAIDAGQFVPAFKNYAIENGVIQGSDGVVTMNASIEVDLSVRADAVRFARAVMACTDDADVELSLTDSGHLRVKQGKLRVIVPALPASAEFPWVDPEGDAYEVPDNLLVMLNALRPFIGTDATRPWSLGIRIHKGKLYATNNVIVVCGALSSSAFDELENVVIPVRAVDELLRINVLPKRILIADTSVTFMHARTWWMRTQRIANDWPDTDAMFDKAKGATMVRISEDFRGAFKRLAPFAPDASPMFIIDGHLATSRNTDVEGAAMEGCEYVNSAFVAGMFRLVMAEATHIGFDRYPQPIPFVGKLLRGIMAVYQMQSTGPAPTEVKPDPKPAKKAAKK